MNFKNDSVNLIFVFIIIFTLLWKISESICMFNFAGDSNVALIIWPAPEHLKFEVNKSIYLECQLKGSANLGSEIKWITPTGNKVPLYRRNEESVFSEPLPHGGLALYIIDLQDNHFGKWTCSSMYGDIIRLTTTFILKSGNEISYIDTPVMQTLNSLEDSSKIICSSNGYPVPEIEWWKNGNVITTGGRYEVVKDGLKIRGVTQEDEGVYECRNYIRERGSIDIKNIKVRVEAPTNLAQSSVIIVDQTEENNTSLNVSNPIISHSFCDFETLDLCGYTQDLDDDFNWTRLYGETPTMQTGPFSDHTYGTRLGHYMYIESSWPQRWKDTARLLSPIKSGNSLYCISFWYNMYGQDIGKLNVFKNSSNSPEILLWSISGNQGKQWKKVQVTIPEWEEEESFRIIFEGVIGMGFTSDIAIDDIHTTNKACDI